MKRMLICFCCAAFFISMAAAALSLAGQGADLSGNWVVRWLDNNTSNPVTLTQTDGSLKGTYVNDSRDVCSVSGKLVQNNSRVALIVDCPKWDIMMEGALSPDGKTVEGAYLAYGTARGSFVMTKKQQSY